MDEDRLHRAAPRVRSRVLRLVLGAVVVLAAFAAACSVAENAPLSVGNDRPDGSAPSFTDPLPEASLPDVSQSLLQCVGTECPTPWETCESPDGGPAYKCGIDLSRDNDNCGACGNKCPTDEAFGIVHMTTRCVSGTCQLECFSGNGGLDNWIDCNGLVDDGCEVEINRDPNNCGACGNRCPEGTPCLDGKCGCPSGKIACHGTCIDPRSDDWNCGACDHICETPADACEPAQPNSHYGCIDGECGKKKCDNNFADCNHDFSAANCDGDGCEVEGLNTTENCGGCGIKCKPHEQCINEGNGYECAVPCERFGKVLCDFECVDLMSDVKHCGACGAPCQMGNPFGLGERTANVTPTCEKGVCLLKCDPGFDDCNGDPTDGCETNLKIDPGNCGACENACDTAAGQPCIEGKCLMTECDAGGPK